MRIFVFIFFGAGTCPVGMAEIRGGWCRVCVGVGDLHGWLDLCHFQNVPMDYVSFAVKQLLSFVSSGISI